MSSDRSITLTPSHCSVPRLMDFILDQKEQPLPTQRELVDALMCLDRQRVRRCHIKISRGKWTIRLVVNEERKYEGEDEKFIKALNNALNEARKLDLN